MSFVTRLGFKSSPCWYHWTAGTHRILSDPSLYIPVPFSSCEMHCTDQQKKNKYIYKQRIDNEIDFYIDRNILQLNLKCWIRATLWYYMEMRENQLNRPFFPVLRSLLTQLRCTWRTALTLHTGRNSPEGPKHRSERCRTLLPGAPGHLICAQTRSKITMSHMAFLARDYSEKFFFLTVFKTKTNTKFLIPVFLENGNKHHVNVKVKVARRK